MDEHVTLEEVRGLIAAGDLRALRRLLAGRSEQDGHLRRRSENPARSRERAVRGE
jgi:hypothetical protein